MATWKGPVFEFLSIFGLCRLSQYVQTFTDVLKMLFDSFNPTVAVVSQCQKGADAAARFIGPKSGVTCTLMFMSEDVCSSAVAAADFTVSMSEGG